MRPLLLLVGGDPVVHLLRHPLCPLHHPGRGAVFLVADRDLQPLPVRRDRLNPQVVVAHPFQFGVVAPDAADDDDLVLRADLRVELPVALRGRFESIEIPRGQLPVRAAPQLGGPFAGELLDRLRQHRRMQAHDLRLPGCAGEHGARPQNRHP